MDDDIVDGDSEFIDAISGPCINRIKRKMKKIKKKKLWPGRKQIIDNEEEGQEGADK
jgi:hypothetical protein